MDARLTEDELTDAQNPEGWWASDPGRAAAEAQLRKALWADEALLREANRCIDTIDQWIGLDYDSNSPGPSAVRDLRKALAVARALREGVEPWFTKQEGQR